MLSWIAPWGVPRALLRRWSGAWKSTVARFTTVPMSNGFNLTSLARKPLACNYARAIVWYEPKRQWSATYLSGICTVVIFWKSLSYQHPLCKNVWRHPWANPLCIYMLDFECPAKNWRHCRLITCAFKIGNVVWPPKTMLPCYPFPRYTMTVWHRTVMVSCTFTLLPRKTLVDGRNWIANHRNTKHSRRKGPSFCGRCWNK
mmetsp:Transcript_5758/g.11232  ORF Transcript_5758/g.11232 Transcript_5758/m.11232 type:complete len:201 (-) Transcript_5758:174-776(-)